MPKAMKKSTREQSPPSEDHNSTDSAEASGSDYDQDPDVSFHPVVPPNQVPPMFMPYIEGPKMNWTVDDGLYHRFLRWRLKCKTILDYKLANLPTKQKYQKVIAWSGNFSMDLYVSWNISRIILHYVIWNKFEEFSKPQTNEVRACFNLLTSFCQGSRNVDEWYNAVQAQVNLANIHLKWWKFSIVIFSGFLCKMKILSQKRSTRVMLISRNFQPVKCAN